MAVSPGISPLNHHYGCKKEIIILIHWLHSIVLTLSFHLTPYLYSSELCSLHNCWYDYASCFCLFQEKRQHAVTVILAPTIQFRSNRYSNNLVLYVLQLLTTFKVTKLSKTRWRNVVLNSVGEKRHFPSFCLFMLNVYTLDYTVRARCNV